MSIGAVLFINSAPSKTSPLNSHEVKIKVPNVLLEFTRIHISPLHRQSLWYARLRRHDRIALHAQIILDKHIHGVSRTSLTWDTRARLHTTTEKLEHPHDRLPPIHGAAASELCLSQYMLCLLAI